ncbi:MAG: hypothetical protein ACRD6X_06450 [Pyrinomonadaceae bacterium]
MQKSARSKDENITLGYIRDSVWAYRFALTSCGLPQEKVRPPQ